MFEYDREKNDEAFVDCLFKTRCEDARGRQTGETRRDRQDVLRSKYVTERLSGGKQIVNRIVAGGNCSPHGPDG